MTKACIRDFRKAGICPDAKYWFKDHGLDWRSFVLNGIDIEDLKATGDHVDLWERVEKIAEEREKRNG